MLGWKKEVERRIWELEKIGEHSRRMERVTQARRELEILLSERLPEKDVKEVIIELDKTGLLRCLVDFNGSYL